MQLVAYGAQDIYLTGNPQITFFKVVYRRHTNFSIETVEHQFVGTPDFNKRLPVKITRNGDLTTKMYLRIILNEVNPGINNFAYVRRLGHAIIREVNVDIAGTTFDRQYGTWMDIWYELSNQGYHREGYNKMIGDVPELTNYNSNTKPEYTLYVPLQFWFNRFIGLAVPLIALQYVDMFINVEIESLERLIIRDCNFDPSLVSIKDATLLVNYVYLDSDERRRFAQVGHEYLIEQIQFNGDQRALNLAQRYRMDFNHPTKEIIWALKNGNYTSGKAFVYYTDRDWSVTEGCCNIIKNSISIGNDPTDISGGTWFEVPSLSTATIGTFNITNNNSQDIWVNPTSLSIGDYGITDQINADVTVTNNGDIICNNVVTTLTMRDFSIPVNQMTDTRFGQCDPIVYQFNNYGLWINGLYNPVSSALIQMNGYDRFDRREGTYFNFVQPEQHHSNTPPFGVNVYSFALYPEEHQPSGTANLSRIDTSDLLVTFSDPTQINNLPPLNFLNEDTRFFIYGKNYNIMRVYSGLAGLAYSTF